MRIKAILPSFNLAWEQLRARMPSRGPADNYKFRELCDEFMTLNNIRQIDLNFDSPTSSNDSWRNGIRVMTCDSIPVLPTTTGFVGKLLLFRIGLE